jgi:hypothetical protein
LPAMPPMPIIMPPIPSMPPRMLSKVEAAEWGRLTGLALKGLRADLA